MSQININQYKPRREGRHSVFSATEEGCTYVGYNPEEKYIRQFLIDGDVFPKGKEPTRCDVLLLDDVEQKSYYIELKRSDIPKAVRQIENTIPLIKDSIQDYTVFCRIVISKARTHKINDKSVIAWKKRYGKNAVIHSVKFEENL